MTGRPWTCRRLESKMAPLGGARRPQAEDSAAKAASKNAYNHMCRAKAPSPARAYSRSAPALQSTMG